MKITFPVYREAAIEEMEACLDMHYLTETAQMSEMSEDGLRSVRALGADTAGHSRPMFEIFHADAFSGLRQPVSPCEACDRFEKSWACPEHTHL